MVSPDLGSSACDVAHQLHRHLLTFERSPSFKVQALPGREGVLDCYAVSPVIASTSSRVAAEQRYTSVLEPMSGETDV